MGTKKRFAKITPLYEAVSNFSVNTFSTLMPFRTRTCVLFILFRYQKLHHHEQFTPTPSLTHSSLVWRSSQSLYGQLFPKWPWADLDTRNWEEVCGDSHEVAILLRTGSLYLSCAFCARRLNLFQQVCKPSYAFTRLYKNIKTINFLGARAVLLGSIASAMSTTEWVSKGCFVE